MFFRKIFVTSIISGTTPDFSPPKFAFWHMLRNGQKWKKHTNIQYLISFFAFSPKKFLGWVTEMTEISEFLKFFKIPKMTQKTRFFRGARCTRVKKLLYPESHQKWHQKKRQKITSTLGDKMTEMTEMTKISEKRFFFEKLTKKSDFLWCEENKWNKTVLPWMKPKKTLFLIIKKTALLWVTKIWQKLGFFMLRAFFGSKSDITLRHTKKDTTF